MASHWRISNGTDMVDLPESFTLQSYNRRTEFIEHVLDGQDGVIVDGESRRESARDLVLTGILTKDNPTDDDLEDASILMMIEDIADSTEDDLELINIDTMVTFSCQHVNTTARRNPAGILNVTIILRTNITIL